MISVTVPGVDGLPGVGSISGSATPLKTHPRNDFQLLRTERVFRIAQYDGVNDFIPFDLSGEKRALVQFLVGEFHSSAICKRSDPLIAHSAPPNGDSVEIIRALDSRCVKLLRDPWHIVDAIRPP